MSEETYNKFVNGSGTIPYIFFFRNDGLVAVAFDLGVTPRSGKLTVAYHLDS